MTSIFIAIKKERRFNTMRKFSILISVVFLLAACKTSYDSASMYDDVYYTPKSENSVKVAAVQSTNNEDLNYGSNIATDRVEQSPDSNSGSDEYSAYQSYYYTETGDTLPSAETTDYSYVEEGYEDYYDYEYASRINRFDNAYGSLGYYSPAYTNVYSPGLSFSMGYGWGFPSSYFSVGFGYGWGYPSYYDPWYYPYYGYGYGCGYYGGSYWAGYNNGYYNGYYAGSGGYYPGGEGGYYPGTYYGPRTSRSGSIVGDGGSRDSRAVSGDDPQNQGYTMGREARAAGTGTATTAGVKASGSTGKERTSREFQPTDASATTTTTGSEKLARPSTQGKTTTGIASEGQQQRNIRAADATTSQKLAKPVQSNSKSNVGARNSITQQKSNTKKTYSAPPNSRDNGVASRSKKYAKPTSNDLQKTATPKNYSSPNYNRPRSSNEYTVPNSRSISGSSAGKGNSRSTSTQGKSNNSRSYYTPSRSTNSFSQPKKSKTYTSPARSGGSYSTPSRSTPKNSSSSRSSGSFSPRSSGSSSGGSSGGSRSSGGSSGGSRSSGGSSGGGRGGR